MGTLFTVNTKARGDAFHCLFPLHLRVFLRTELARMKLYDLKSAKWFPGLGGKVLMCSKLKTGLKTCRPKVGNLRSPGTGALLPRHLDIYVCRQQHAPIQNSCNCVCWHLTWTSWLCLLDTDGASWMHLHMFLIEVSSLEWEWGELTGIGIRCYPLSNTAKALGLAHTCRPVGTTAKEIVFFAYFIKTWEDFLLFGGKKKGNYLRFWKVLKDVFFLFFVGVCIFTSCWTMFTGSLLILFPRRILSRSVGLF